MGRQHGEKAKAHIDRMMAYCFGKTTLRAIGTVEKDVITHTEPLLPLADAYAPDLVEQCRGIAAGSGYDFREVFSLQYFVDFWPEANPALSACSTILAIDRSGQEPRVLLGWNDDMPADPAPATVILRSVPDRGPAITGICFAGTIPECGATRNMAIACNSLPGPVAPEGVPYIFIQRKALQQSTLREAVQVIRSARRMCPMNYLVVSGSGDFVDTETAPDRCCLPPTREKSFIHTNHALSPEMPKGERDAHMRDSITRYAFLQRSLHRLNDSPTRDDVIETLSSHEGGLCRHNHDHISTVTCMVCDLSAGRIAFSTGPPCLNRFRKLDL